MVNRDSRLDTIIRRQAQLNLLALRYQPGFRVQVVSTGDRSMANEIKAAMLRNFPQYHAYLIYQSPSFKVRVGDFRDQEQADALRDQISKLYPSGVFVVPDIINTHATDKVNNDDPTN